MNGIKTTRKILVNAPYPMAYMGPEYTNVAAIDVAERIDGTTLYRNVARLIIRSN